MSSPATSRELERICACGRSVCARTLGARGSLTSTAVKFLGALSWASHSTRRPSRAICMPMPSPIPPKPLRACWESSFMLRNMAPKIREIASELRVLAPVLLAAALGPAPVLDAVPG